MKHTFTQRAHLLRNGNTLLEILLAGVILAIALAALTQQSFVAVQAAKRTELETRASIRCSSRLSELLISRQNLNGPLSGVSADDSRWHWEMEWVPSSFPDTHRMTVRVWREGPNQRLTRYSVIRLLTDTVLPDTDDHRHQERMRR